MSESKTVGVKELKDNLSAYLREVRRGTRILVTDRNVVVAEIYEPGGSYAADRADDPVLAAWVRDGLVVPATRKKEPMPESPVRLAAGTSLGWLDDSRAENGT